MNHLYEDQSGVIHLCESAGVYPGVLLVWTKCEEDVPPNQSFRSREVATCHECLRAAGGER